MFERPKGDGEIWCFRPIGDGRDFKINFLAITQIKRTPHKNCG